MSKFFPPVYTLHNPPAKVRSNSFISINGVIPARVKWMALSKPFYGTITSFNDPILFN
jgi:hypothetical protein